MAKGLYIREDGTIIVDYGSRKIAIPRAQYRANGYRPPAEQLPKDGPPTTSTDSRAGPRHAVDEPKTTRT